MWNQVMLSKKSQNLLTTFFSELPQLLINPVNFDKAYLWPNFDQERETSINSEQNRSRWYSEQKWRSKFEKWSFPTFSTNWIRKVIKKGIYWHQICPSFAFSYVHICFSLFLQKQAGLFWALNVLKPHTGCENLLMLFSWQQCVSMGAQRFGWDDCTVKEA